MAKESTIRLTVVVSGSPESISIKDHHTVADLMRKALHKAKLPDDDLAGWSLRFAEGGEPIPPEEKIAKAGITDGATLFLNRDAGGGGQVAVSAPAEEKPAPVLVDPAVSAAKLRRELEDWEQNRAVYEERGWILLGHGELHVDVAFTARLPVGPVSDLPAIPLAVRFGFENYDLWPPSVRVIDPISRRWLQVPRVGALDFDAGVAGAPLNLFVLAHPDTGRVFFCKPGVREYHQHPEHSGDDWLLYRGNGYGTLGSLCDLLWRRAVHTVTGLNIFAQRIPRGEAAVVNQGIELRQENVDELTTQFQGGMPIMIGGPPTQGGADLPPELAEQLGGLFGQVGPG
jgi:hypothetical protein